MDPTTPRAPSSHSASPACSHPTSPFSPLPPRSQRKPPALHPISGRPHPVTNRPLLPFPRGTGTSSARVTRAIVCHQGPHSAGLWREVPPSCHSLQTAVSCEQPDGPKAAVSSQLTCTRPAPPLPARVACITQERTSRVQCPHTSGVEGVSLNEAVPPRLPCPRGSLVPAQRQQQGQEVSPGSVRLMWPLAWLDGEALLSAGLGVGQV